MKLIKPSSVLSQLRSLGIAEGDLVFVSANLLNVGLFRGSRDHNLKTWVHLLTEVVGPNGTLVIPAYSPSYFIWQKPFRFIFTEKSSSESGSLPNAFIQYCQHVQRSTHPTCSCLAVGPLASEVLEQHTPDSSSYLPYKRVIELGGKNLMLGTLDTKNAPMTLHAAQEALGHTELHPFANLRRTVFSKGPTTIVYTIRDFGGCTRGFSSHWASFLSSTPSTRFTKVGNSYSALIDAEESYRYFISFLQHHPESIKCSNNLCISCYGRPLYNRFYLIFYIRKILAVAYSAFRGVFRK